MIRSILLALSLFALSCTPQQQASVQSAIDKVVIAAVQSGEMLDWAQSTVDELFKKFPNAALQTKVNHAIADTRLAVLAVEEASYGATGANDQDVEAAVKRFQSAWELLKPLLAEAGVYGTARASEIPEPMLAR